MSRYFLLTALFFFISATTWKPYPPKSALDALAQWHYSFPQEIAYVQQDKSYYSLGETLWFKVYLVNAIDHSFLTPSQTVYVELINEAEEIVARRNIRVSEGAGSGDFHLAPQWQAGRYILRAYTKYMLNFDEAHLFHRSFELSKVAANVDEGPDEPKDNADGSTVRFFPEGGDLICGLKNTVGVKSSVPIKARVLDSDDNLVTLFATNEQGYGKFSYVPNCELDYRIELVDDPSSKNIALPVPKSSGHSLTLQNTHKEEIFVQVVCSPDQDLDGSYVLGHLRGGTPWLFDELQGESMTFSIKASELKGGVHHLTLFSADDQPVAERLLYVHKEIIAVKAGIQSGSIGQMEKVNLELEFPDLEKPTENIQAALSIFEEKIGLPENNISAHLLLAADLPGSIEHPAHYFEDPNSPRLKEIDLIMLTHGWRRFTWKDALGKNYPTIKHLPENGFSFEGITKRGGVNGKPMQGEVLLSTMSSGFKMISAPSDSTGRFIFRDLDLQDTTGLVFRGQRASDVTKKKSKKGGLTKAKKLDIDMMDIDRLIIDQPLPPRWTSRFTPEFVTNYTEVVRYNSLVDESYGNLWSVDLEEVVISDTKLDPDVKYHESSIIYEDPDNRLLIKDFPQSDSYINLFDFIRGKVPGVQVIGTFPERTVRIRGTNSISLNPNASFLLDGAVVTAGFLNTFPMDRIAFIDVIKSMSKSTALGGNQSGVVAVYTKSTIEGDPKERVSDLVSMEHPGYYQAREFYQPESGDASNRMLEYRTTLHWEPKLTFEDGKAEIEFYTSNQSTSYLIVVEGITDQGKQLWGTSKFAVN